MLAETPFCGSKPASGDNKFVNIQEGFVLLCRLCLRNMDAFAEDFSHKSKLCCILISVIILRLFDNEIRGSILLSFIR